MELPSKTILLKLYRDLVASRQVEAELYAKQGYLAGSGGGAHRGVGEEVIPIAICNNLTETDSIHPNFRTFYCLFAKPGFTMYDVVATCMFRDSGKFTLFAAENGTLGSSSTLGEASVRYVGAAVTASIKHTKDIVVFIQGDGASNRAPTHEAMAVAAAWNLPIINNKYGMGTAVEKAYNIKDLSVRGAGYGFPHETVDGNDMIAMYQVAKKHVERCRAGGGPSLIAADTWRLRPHYEGDPQIYRPKGEVEEWWKKEPLSRYQKELMDLGVLTEKDIERMEEEVKAEIEEAFQEIEKLPIVMNYENIEKTAVAEL